MDFNLSINSITKTFNNNKIIANDNISTQFIPGKITALTGHNGAGKTTLLNQIMGIVRPNKGSITFAGHSFTQEPALARRMISMMPQLHAPLAGVSLRQSIEAIARIRGSYGNVLKEEVAEVIDSLKINDWADISGEKLSGGLQRLTSFAMTVVAPSPILLFDEPTNDVDPVRRKLIWQYLRKLAQQNYIVIVVTHNLLEVDQYADRYLLLDHGQLVKDESTDILTNDLLSSAILTISTKRKFKKEEFPQTNTIVTSEDFQYELFLGADEIANAITWLYGRMGRNEIRHYSLTPASLNTIYGGLTDGNE